MQVYCHPQADCYVVFGVGRYVGRLKLGSKPDPTLH